MTRQMLHLAEEPFVSVQGEGANAGRLCTFVRLAGCNRRCEWCDTQGSWKASPVIGYEPATLAAAVKTRLVVVTGGEPILQRQGLREFADAVRAGGRVVALETNGDLLEPDDVPHFDFVAVAPKDRNALLRASPLVVAGEVKLVVGDAAWTPDAVLAAWNDGHLAGVSVVLQPLWTADKGDRETALRQCVKVLEVLDVPTVRIGLQLHRMVGWR
jgi:organic radical activating enzyme